MGYYDNYLVRASGAGHQLQSLGHCAVGEHIQKRRLAQGNVKCCFQRVIDLGILASTDILAVEQASIEQLSRHVDSCNDSAQSVVFGSLSK